jgi:proton-coupled amino acid transporter
LLHYKAVAKNRFRKWSDILLCIFGFVAMAYTTSLTVMAWAGDSGPQLPGHCESRGV